MEWRCKWCGKPHEENDPPCDNCGHGTFERAVEQVSHEVVEGGPVWVCQDCGREHQKHSPPCSRCGGSDFERRIGPPETDPLDEIGTGWLDVLEAKYVLGYAAVAVVLGVVLLGLLGVVSLPTLGGPSGPPEIPSAPGSADTADGLSLSAVEDAYVDALNDRRANEGASALTRNGTADAAAAYYNKALVDARVGDGSGPDREAVERFGLACERPSVVAYQVAYERTGRSVSDFENESALAASLVDSYVERGTPFRTAEAGTVGVDVHVAPGGTVFVTYVVC
ncbi:zinc ribbon-containing protein [Halomicroarcula limicola]|uniref:Zinc ribbon-containing protein n=1 Tax=Haloarcula limicola TaxID=1429915 RepID=A0A8J7YDI7_9EURY|nr:hypothetical protein [Halomicroarcula limicola]MBV0924518.1 zinc ribbon-containing protein [Halomicroarcula limicola]